MLSEDRKAKGKRQTKATECQPASPCPLPQQAPNHDHTSCPLPPPAGPEQEVCRSRARSTICENEDLETHSSRILGPFKGTLTPQRQGK